MKKNAKRILALLLTLAMVCSMAACGKEQESSTAEGGGSEVTLLSDELGYGFLSQYQELDLPMDYVNSVSSVNGKLYLGGEHYDDENYTYQTMMVEMDPATGEFTANPMGELAENQYYQNISIAGDGSGYWMIVVTWNDTYTEEIDPGFGVDMEEPAEEGSAFEEEVPADSDDPAAEGAVEVMPALEGSVEAVATPLAASVAIAEPAVEDDGYVTPSETYTLMKYDMAGNLLQEMDLTPLMEEMDYFYVQNVVELTSGDVVLFCDQKFITYGADGTRKADVELNGYVESAQPLADGTAVLSYYDYENGGQKLARLDNGTLTEITTDYNSNNGCRIFPKDETSIYVTDYNVLYAMDLATGQTEEVLSWLDSDIIGTSVSAIAPNGEDIAVVTNRYDEIRGEQVYELIQMAKTPADQIPERTIITLGCLWLDSRTQQQVVNFNRASQTYRVTMVDYSQYNTTEDYSLGQSQLEKDILTGACPDIIDISGLSSVKKYATKGVFADLKTLIEQDPDYTMDSFMSGPLNAFTYDGKLCAMPLTCAVETMYGSARILGDSAGTITLDALEQAISGLDDETCVMQYLTASGMLSNLVNWNFDQLVDYSTATCSFDSPMFISILNMASKLPAEIDWENDTMIYMDEMQMLQEGSCLLASNYVSDQWSIKNMYNLYTEENGFLNLGVPGSENGGGVLSVYYGFAVSASSKHQDAAWEFIKTMLTDEAQASYYEIPVTISAFEKFMAETMEEPYYMDGDEKVYYEETMYIGDTEYVLEPLTQAQVDDFKAFVNNAAYNGNYDSDMYSIIAEEAEAFFAGDKTAEEVASLIQNRVQIYLGETS